MHDLELSFNIIEMELLDVSKCYVWLTFDIYIFLKILYSFIIIKKGKF